MLALFCFGAVIRCNYETVCHVLKTGGCVSCRMVSPCRLFGGRYLATAEMKAHATASHEWGLVKLIVALAAAAVNPFSTWRLHVASMFIMVSVHTSST